MYRQSVLLSGQAGRSSKTMLSISNCSQVAWQGTSRPGLCLMSTFGLLPEISSASESISTQLTFLLGYKPQLVVTMAAGVQSTILLANYLAANPPKTTECTAPMRAQAHAAKRASGIMGMQMMTRSPVFTPLDFNRWPMRQVDSQACLSVQVRSLLSMLETQMSACLWAQAGRQRSNMLQVMLRMPSGYQRAKGGSWLSRMVLGKVYHSTSLACCYQYCSLRSGEAALRQASSYAFSAINQFISTAHPLLKPIVKNSLWVWLVWFYLMEGLYGAKYERLQRIGNGAYGVIYKVRAVQGGQIFIAKHIPVGQIEREKALQEFDILSKLKHNYIVRYIDSFSEEEELVLIMEYCGERDVAWHIEQRRKTRQHFSETLVTNWILQMILAVGFMHANKILHRDLKPQNIFVDSEMNLKLGDFGISRLLDSTHQHCKTSAGTPSYMAPQMVDSQNYGFKADVWSLGCVIYEVCALERLFPVKDAENRPVGLFKMMDLIKNAEIREIPSFYSKDLRELVKKLLVRNPDKRPRCQELLKDRLLVNLMVNKISAKDSLRQEYPKSISIPSLSESLLQRQAKSVEEQMRKMEIQVREKMCALKNKRVDRRQLDDYQREIKAKMKEVERAVRAAFEQLHKKGSFNENKKEKEEDSPSRVKREESNPSKIKNNSSNFSDLTIKSKDFSIKTKRSKPAEDNQSSIDLVESQMVQSKPLKTPNQSLNNQSNLSCTIKSMMINSKPQQIERPPPPFEDPFEGTIQSQYSATNNEPAGIANTINRLDLLTQTLKKNPQAVLSDSFLNCTLSLSQDASREKQREKQKEKMEVSASISLELTRQSSPKPPTDPQENYYHQDFQEYEQNEDVEARRASEMRAMLTLYEQTLADMGGNSSNDSSSKFKNKYLVMSEIKEQSNEGGSMLSRQDAL